MVKCDFAILLHLSGAWEMTKKPQKVKVSQRAVTGRLQRILAKDGHKLCKCRGDTRQHQALGDYYLLDTYRNTVVDSQIEFEEFARKVGALKPHEEIE